MKYIMFGIFAEPLSEQLKEFNIPKEKTDEWDIIRNFVFSAHIKGIITNKAIDKIFDYLAKQISDYIKEL